MKGAKSAAALLPTLFPLLSLDDARFRSRSRPAPSSLGFRSRRAAAGTLGSVLSACASGSAQGPPWMTCPSWTQGRRRPLRRTWRETYNYRKMLKIFKSYLTQWPQFYLKTKGSLLFASERGHSIIEKTFYSMAAFDFLCFPSRTILEKVLLLSTTANFLFVLRQRYKNSEMRSQIPSQRRRRRHKHLCFSPSIPFPSFFQKNCVKQKRVAIPPSKASLTI